MNLVEQLAASVGVELPGPDYTTALPSVLDDVPAGSSIILERKTSGEDISPGSTFWIRKMLDVQPTMYLAAHPNAVFVLYDVLKKPELEPRQATPIELRKYTKATKKDPVPRLYASHRDRDETPHEYFVRISEDIQDRPEFYYQRGIVVRLEAEMERAAVNIWQQAQEIHVAQRRGSWPMSPSSCFDFGRRCEYHGVCSGSASINDESRFETREQKTHLPMLSASAINVWASCHRKYYYAYELRRRPREHNPVLSFGTRVHKALEAWSVSGLDAAVQIATQGNYDHDAAKAHAMVLGYHARWAGNPLRFLSLEHEFSTQLVDPHTGAVSDRFTIGGSLDALAEKI